MPDYLGTDQRKVAKKDEKEEKIEGKPTAAQNLDFIIFKYRSMIHMKTFLHNTTIKYTLCVKKMKFSCVRR